MNEQTLESGMIVRSKAGRDSGRAFAVVEVLDADYVLIADGRCHKLAAPKRKKIKHLWAKPVLLNLETLRPEGGKLQDSDLRRALEDHGFSLTKLLHEEG